MKLKSIILVAALLLSSGALMHVRGQQTEITPLYVESPVSTMPSMVRTGELFTSTYRIHFLRRTDSGEEVIPLVDETFRTADGEFVSFGSFELVDYDVVEHEPIGDHVQWDVTLTFMIINEKKTGDPQENSDDPVSYTVPEIAFTWAIKPIGEELNLGRHRQNAMRSAEVPVSYKSSIPENAESPQPYENVAFPSFDLHANTISYGGWALILLLLAAAALYVWWKTRTVHHEAVPASGRLEKDDAEEFSNLRLPARHVVRKQTIQDLQSLNKLSSATSDAALRRAQHDFRGHVRRLLVAEVGLTLSATEEEVLEQLQEKRRGTETGDKLIQLARTVIACRDAEHENRVVDDLGSKIENTIADIQSMNAGLQVKKFIGKILSWLGLSG